MTRAKMLTARSCAGFVAPWPHGLGLASIWLAPLAELSSQSGKFPNFVPNFSSIVENMHGTFNSLQKRRCIATYVVGSGRGHKMKSRNTGN